MGRRQHRPPMTARNRAVTARDRHTTPREAAAPAAGRRGGRPCLRVVHARYARSAAPTALLAQRYRRASSPIDPRTLRSNLLQPE